MLWHYRTGYPVFAEPVAAGGAVYVGSDKMYCLDERTGQVRWAFEPIGKISSRAVVAGDRVYFTCGGLHCLDARTGAVLWEFWGDDWGQAAPVMHRGRVYTALGSSIYCVDGESGHRIWALVLKQSPVGIQSVTDREVVLCQAGRIVSLDPGTGTPRWSFETGMRRACASVAGGRVFVCGWGQELLCLDASAGTLLWRRDIGEFLLYVPVVQDDRVLIVIGQVLCFDVVGGAHLWAAGDTDSRLGGGVMHGGMLFVYDFATKQVRAFDPERREFVETIEVPPGRFAVTADHVLVSSGDYRVYCCPRREPPASRLNQKSAIAN